MKYVVLIFLIAVIATFARAVYPTYRDTNLCISAYEKDLPSRRILSGNNNTESYCKASYMAIENVVKCKQAVTELEKIEGTTKVLFKLRETSSIKGREIKNAIVEHNHDCQRFQKLLLNQEIVE